MQNEGEHQLNLEDHKYLESVAESAEVINTCIPSRLFTIKDTNSIHLYCSAAWLDLIGLTTNDVIGTSLVELTDRFGSRILGIKEEEAEIIKLRKPRFFLKILNYKDGFSPRIIVKYPIINPETTNVVGVICECIDANVFNLSRYLYNDFDCDTLLDLSNELKPIHLSRREKQVIFLFLANMHSQDIVEIINHMEHVTLTKSAIDSIFRNLFAKFRCKTRIQLYGVLLHYNYDKLVPRDVLNECSIPLSYNFMV